MGKLLTLVKAICFKGQKGDKGDPGVSVSVGSTVTGDPGTPAAVENVGTASDPILNFTIPKGDTGVSVESIAKTSTSGNVDTYTITMTDGTTYTFTVRNGEHKQAYISQAAYNALVDAGTVDPECYYYITDDHTVEEIYQAISIPAHANEWGTYYPDRTTAPFLPGLYLLMIEIRGSNFTSNAVTALLFLDESRYDQVYSSCFSFGTFLLRVKATPIMSGDEWAGGYSLSIETIEGYGYSDAHTIRYQRVGRLI